MSLISMLMSGLGISILGISGSFYFIASVAPLKSIFMSGLGISILEIASMMLKLDCYLF